MSEVRFGDYRITETIGAGALSTIYRAIQEPLGRVVALKALKAQIAATSSFGEQLDREAKILADLTHPNVVLLLEASRTTSGRPYVVLEHVDGPSLHEVLARRKASAKPERAVKSGWPSLGSKPPPATGALDVATTLAVACGICAALEHVHERGIVHRDVKPSNVLLARTGVVKLIDFGIAQRPRTHSVSDGFAEGITASGRMAPEQLKDGFGTPAYMSPEQILGDFVDGRSDLFSLGVVLYEMLSGSRPFDVPENEKRASASAIAVGAGPRSERSAAQRIRRDAPPALRERAPDCPRGVERIVMRLLEKAPNDRYPSASTVRERLESALKSETREDPAAIVRAALGVRGASTPPPPRVVSTAAPARVASRVEAGARGVISGTGTGTGTTRKGAAVSRERSRFEGLGRIYLAFAAVLFLFVVGAVAIEVGGRDARGHGAGSSDGTLALAPESAGGLRVLATPWAYVRVDGQLVETTPFARPIPLAAGKHWVTLSHPEAARPVERSIDVAPGEVVALEVTLDLSLDDGGVGSGKDAR